MRLRNFFAAAIPLSFMAFQIHAQISGPRSLCEGTTIVLSDPTLGGSWTSDNHSVATISPFTAMVTGVSPGTAVISYLGDTVHITVTALHSIMGGSVTLCSADTIMLTDPMITTSLLWQFSYGWPNWLVGTPPYLNTTSGLFTATTIDTGSIYASGIDGSGLASCGLVHISVTDLPSSPSAITGPSSVNVGATIHLSEPTPDGTWHSARPTIATVDASGNVHGVAAGTDTVFYILSNACGNASVFYIVTVNSVSTGLPNAGSSTAFSFYPNPVFDRFVVEGRATGHLMLIDQLGRIHGSWNVKDGRTSIDVSQVSAGLYFLTMQSGDEFSRQTIIINH